MLLAALQRAMMHIAAFVGLKKASPRQLQQQTSLSTSTSGHELNPSFQTNSLVPLQSNSSDGTGALEASEEAVQSVEPVPQGPSWYISEQQAYDLVKRTQAQDEGREPGWSFMMAREQFGLFTYTAEKRALFGPGGKRVGTEYRTVTTLAEASTLELMEFYLDDSARLEWEAFLKQARVLEVGEGKGWSGWRELVVRWVRRFPLSYLSEREYIIARKAWAQLWPPPSPVGSAATAGESVECARLGPLSAADPGAALYAVSQSLDEHPMAPLDSSVIRTGSFLSQWRCRAVPDPWGRPGHAPAAEAVLLHTEDIKISDYLARTAVALGMSAFVQDLAGGAERYLAERRTKRGLSSRTLDPTPYGHLDALQHGHSPLLVLPPRTPGPLGPRVGAEPWGLAEEPEGLELEGATSHGGERMVGSPRVRPTHQTLLHHGAASTGQLVEGEDPHMHLHLHPSDSVSALQALARNMPVSPSDSAVWNRGEEETICMIANRHAAARARLHSMPLTLSPTGGEGDAWEWESDTNGPSSRTSRPVAGGTAPGAAPRGRGRGAAQAVSGTGTGSTPLEASVVQPQGVAHRAMSLVTAAWMLPGKVSASASHTASFALGKLSATATHHATSALASAGALGHAFPGKVMDTWSSAHDLPGKLLADATCNVSNAVSAIVGFAQHVRHHAVPGGALLGPATHSVAATTSSSPNRALADTPSLEGASAPGAGPAPLYEALKRAVPRPSSLADTISALSSAPASELASPLRSSSGGIRQGPGVHDSGEGVDELPGVHDNANSGRGADQSPCPPSSSGGIRQGPEVHDSGEGVDELPGVHDNANSGRGADQSPSPSSSSGGTRQGPEVEGDEDSHPHPHPQVETTEEHSWGDVKTTRGWRHWKVVVRLRKGLRWAWVLLPLVVVPLVVVRVRVAPGQKREEEEA